MLWIIAGVGITLVLGGLTVVARTFCPMISGRMYENVLPETEPATTSQTQVATGNPKSEDLFEHLFQAWPHVRVLLTESKIDEVPLLDYFGRMLDMFLESYTQEAPEEYRAKARRIGGLILWDPLIIRGFQENRFSYKLDCLLKTQVSWAKVVLSLGPTHLQNIAGAYAAKCEQVFGTSKLALD